ncbi:MAG: lmo0937 family membrane protein [Thermodesulfobacteriota bacterium]
MLWLIAAALMVVWMLGLGSGFGTGIFIHLLYVVAVALLVVNHSREVESTLRARCLSRSRAPRPNGKRVLGKSGFVSARPEGRHVAEMAAKPSGGV